MLRKLRPGKKNGFPFKKNVQLSHENIVNKERKKNVDIKTCK